MYGLIGHFTAAEGKRDELVELLLEASASMPGCLGYVVSRDPAEPDRVWVVETWDSQASHEASLAIPEVREAIQRARPLIRAMDSVATLEPVGGVGLPSPS